MISFEGIPAVYFNSLFGKSNDEAKYIITGNNRDVNRYKWNFNNITTKLRDKKSKQSIFYRNIGALLEIKRKQKAFHPNASRININLGPKIFCFKRISKDKKQSIICMTNLSSKIQTPNFKKIGNYRDLLNSNLKFREGTSLILKPFQTVWLTNN